jgi:hypothetical protein
MEGNEWGVKSQEDDELLLARHLYAAADHELQIAEEMEEILLCSLHPLH